MPLHPFCKNTEALRAVLDVLFPDFTARFLPAAFLPVAFCPPQKLLFLLLFGTLVVDDRHFLFGYERYAVFLRPIDTALQHYRQKNARNVQDGFQRVVGKLYGIVGAVGRVTNGIQRLGRTAKSSGIMRARLQYQKFLLSR